MSAWRTLRLGDALEIKHGFAFKGEYFSSEGGPYVVLTPGNFRDEGGFKPKSGAEKFYDGPVPNGYILSPGDIVVAMTEQSQGLLGSSGTIPEGALYLHNQRIGLVDITDPEILDARFVYHLFNSERVRDQLQATATGSKVRHTAPERIKGVSVPVPDVPTQRRISEVLDSIDNLIENNRRRIALLEQMAQAIYREWFVRFRYPGYESDEFVDSSLGPIPAGWRVVPVADVAVLHRQTVHPSHSPETMFEHFSIPNFDDGRLPAWETGEAIKSGKYAVSAPSVLVSKLNPRIHRVWLAAPTTLDRSVASTEFLVLRPKEWPLEFLHQAFSSSTFQDQVVGLAGGTSTSHQRAKPDDFMGLEIIEPRQGMVEHAATVIAPMVSATLVLRRAAVEAARIRELLLPKLVTGAVDVSALHLDPLPDEPAVREGLRRE